MKKRDIHCGSLGNGLSFYDVNNEKHGDYESVAHADSRRAVKFYVNNLTDKEKEQVFNQVKNCDNGVSVTQEECKIFGNPPNKDYEYIFIINAYYPHLNNEIIK